MKILHLTLKRKWFDMILSGEKKEEYREIKEYWYNRLCMAIIRNGEFVQTFKEFDAIEFRNGYSKNARKFLIELKGIKTNTGNTNWGAELEKRYYVLMVGKIIKTWNI